MRARVFTISFAALMAFFLTPFLPVPGTAGATYYEDLTEGVITDSPQTDLESHPWERMTWDWEAYADDEGYVDVIVSVRADHSSLVASETLGRAMSSVVMDGDGMQMKQMYSHAFSGFSARVTLDKIAEIESESAGQLYLYPDLPVNATLTESVYQIGADQLWARQDSYGTSVTGVGVVVSIIDTGVDYRHPDLGGDLGPSFKVIGGYDFVNGDSDPMDDNGHGTHVAGIVAADGAIKGVAPGAQILAYKVLDSGGSGSMSDVVAAIERSLDPNQDGDTSDRADIISMSLGGSGEIDDPACLAVRAAVEQGVVVVVAAGNSGPNLGTVGSPGLAPEAITVGAADKSGNLASFSSRGTMPEVLIKPEISAPGVSINSTVPYADASLSSSTGYRSLSGTSMATPHVSGGAALLLQLHPGWSPEQVKSAIVSGAGYMNASLWSAGSGLLSLPTSSEMQVFFSPALLSYGIAADPAEAVTITGTGGSAPYSVTPEDWFALSGDGDTQFHDQTNLASATPTSVTIGFGVSAALSIDVGDPYPEMSEGYYDGQVHLRYGSTDALLPFGFALLSRLNVHVFDIDGREVNDPYGGVYVYDLPDANVAMGIRGGADPAPPASFLLPSGQYSVHALGHQLLYDHDDPYALSQVITLGTGENKNVSLTMASARELTLDLETDGGLPIYAKDYRVYVRHVGLRNISFHLVGTDYDISGDDLLSIPKSMKVYVSDTQATVGLQISGFSYTPSMWDFMIRNKPSSDEFLLRDSTDFHIPASADLQYLMAWEFDGVDQSVPTTLGLVEGKYSVYDTKYDIPGTIDDVWCNWGTHSAIGGQASFYVRRDTETPVNTFYSGMTRRTYVQGVFSNIYYPQGLFDGFFEQEYYVPDFNYLSRANTISEIYLANRNFITPIEGVQVEERVGSGPFYPALSTGNTNEQMVLFQPLLRDQSGAKIGDMTHPNLYLYRNGLIAGIYQLVESRARPDAVRVINLTDGPGSYSAKISYTPMYEICEKVEILLGFTVPSADVNPPRVTGLTFPSRFTPGDALPLELRVSDDLSSVSAEVSWRLSGTTAWSAMPVQTPGPGVISASVPTSATATSIDVMFKITDASGNYLKYTANNASLAKVPVVFELAAESSDIPYRNGDSSALITGRLTDLDGNLLHATGAVPLELYVSGKKVAMLLDDYVEGSSHSHNGTIRFDWHFNPANIFTGPGQTAEVTVAFDIGIYEPVVRSFLLHSVEYYNQIPQLSLLSPLNNSLIAAGTVVDIDISDDGPVIAEAFLDGVTLGLLAEPWDIDTSAWSDGAHVLRVVVTDEGMAQVSAEFAFEVDRFAPELTIVSPSEGSLVPINWTAVLDVADDHLSYVTYSLDAGSPEQLVFPYEISMAGWAVGVHALTVAAGDTVGHVTSRTVSFEIADSTLVISIDSPGDGAVIRSGVTITFSVLGAGNILCSWSESGTTHDLGLSRAIDTAGWTEGYHPITISARSDVGGECDADFQFMIDNTSPTLDLVSPANQTFVTMSDSVHIRVQDPNFDHILWSVWGVSHSGSSRDLYVDLSICPGDGYFTISVSAFDAAGNFGQASFVFAMDSAAPSLSVVDPEEGTAIIPGDILRADASDIFLSSVTWSLDGGAIASLAQPYEIGSAGFSLGWHTLYLTALDFSGKQTWYNRSFFVDGLPPTVNIISPEKYTRGQPLEIVMAASDDFGVSSVVVRYALLDTSYGSEAAYWNGSFWIATLPSSVLWNNITVYAIAFDTVGNQASSPTVSVQQSLEPFVPPGGDSDDSPSGGNGGFSFLSWDSMGWLSIIGSIAAVVIVSLMYVSYGKPKKNSEDEPVTKPAVTLQSIVTKAPVPQASGYSVSRSTQTASLYERSRTQSPVPTARMSTIEPRAQERKPEPRATQAPVQMPVVAPEQQRFRLGPEHHEMPEEELPDFDLLATELEGLAALAERAVEKKMGIRSQDLEGGPKIEKPLRPRI